ncbi:MAG: MotA/TolQ/ExbB proton channel family protein [Verrucomicrobiota bacterium]
MKSIVSHLVTIVLLLGISLPSYSQDDFDLSIPGEEESAPAPSAASTAPTSSAGGANSGEVNLLQMIKAGGWSMWVLGTFSIAVIGLLVFCLIDLQRKNFYPEPLVNSLATDLESIDYDGALQKSQGSATCLGNVMEAGLAHIGERGYEALEGEKLEETMAAASRRSNRVRVRTINYFSILAQAAPMMGLLGTVSGMIGAFAKLSQGGTGDPSKFAGDISEALITTASGLVVALPAIFCYFIFRDRLQQLAAECDESAEDLMNTLRKAVNQSHS